jgi:Tfp pilus assembly protein PilO
VLPLSRKVSGGEEEAQRASTELSAARRDYDSARATVTGKAQADVELKRFYQDVLPSSFSGARRVLFPSIEQLAKKSNLRYHDANIQADGEPIGDLQKVSMTFNLAGEYTNIRRFIHELETEPEFRVIESVALAQAEEGERGLNVTAHVATYYRTGGNGN